jgi:hypothetical protein
MAFRKNERGATINDVVCVVFGSWTVAVNVVAVSLWGFPTLFLPTAPTYRVYLSRAFLPVGTNSNICQIVSQRHDPEPSRAPKIPQITSKIKGTI